MPRAILACLLLCFGFAFLKAKVCAPIDIEYSAVDYLIYLKWSYNESSLECSSGHAIILSEPGTQISYYYNGYGAMINVPLSCSTYRVGVMPYSENEETGPIEYFNVTTGTPSYIYMDYLLIRKNDTYIRAEWAADETTENCSYEYQILITLTNYTSPLDTESFEQMSVFHRQTTTSYDIMAVEDCVNNTISIVVAPYSYNGFTGQSLTDTYTCN